MRICLIALAALTSCALSAAPALEPDVVTILNAEAKLLKSPEIKPHANLPNLLEHFLQNQTWGANGITTSASIDLNTLKALGDLLLNPAVIKAMLLGANSGEPKGENQEPGLVITRFASHRPNLFSTSRGHLQKIHALPEVRAENWSKMRADGASVRDMRGTFAGHPLIEYCASDAGKAVPRSGVMNISVLDMAIAEAAWNRLDMSLLHLLDQPDAFSRQRLMNIVEPKVAEESPWQIFYQAWASGKFRMKNNRGISQWILGSKSFSDPKVTLFSEALKSAFGEMKLICTKKGGRWRENVIVPYESTTNIFECLEDHNDSFAFVVEEDIEFPENSSLLFRASRKGYFGEIRLDTGEASSFPIELRVSKMDNATTDRLFFAADGSPRARISSQSNNSPVAWNSEGRVVWSGRISANDLWLEDISWSDSGAPKSKVSFNSKGEMIRFVEWHEGGFPSRLIDFERERADGLERWWHPSGILAGEINWYSGKKFGSGRVVFENGAAAFDGAYVDDRLDGPVVWRDEQGREVFTAKFKTGSPDGVLQIGNGDGATLALANFDRGRAEGIVGIGVDAQRSGGRLNFVSGILDGTSEFFDANGVRKLTIPFQSGKLHGDLKGFYANDRMAMSCGYENGHLNKWSVLPSKQDDVNFEMHGKLLDSQRGVADMLINSHDLKIQSHCTSSQDVWTNCQWKIGGVSSLLRKENLAFAVSEAKNPRSRAQIVQWDLSPWLELNKPFVHIDVTAKRGSRFLGNYRCEVQLAAKLPILGCQKIAPEHDHNHD